MILTRSSGRSLGRLQATPSTALSSSWLPALYMTLTGLDVAISGSDVPGVYFHYSSTYICSIYDGSCHVELRDCVRGCSAASISDGLVAAGVDTVRRWRGPGFPLQSTFHRSHGVGLQSAWVHHGDMHDPPGCLGLAQQVAVHPARSHTLPVRLGEVGAPQRRRRSGPCCTHLPGASRPRLGRSWGFEPSAERLLRRNQHEPEE